MQERNFQSGPDAEQKTSDSHSAAQHPLFFKPLWQYLRPPARAGLFHYIRIHMASRFDPSPTIPGDVTDSCSDGACSTDHGGPLPSLSMPRLLYGTAWKEDKTADLVYEAIKAGFRGIDTAAMRKHYREDLVGEGIRRAIREGIVRREELYIQTKFTPQESQHTAISGEELEMEIKQSIKSSLRNLVTPYLDSVVLHSPLRTVNATVEAWKVLSAHVPHPVRAIGISNVTANLLKTLWPTPGPGPSPGPGIVTPVEEIEISHPPLRLPAMVQNNFCRRNGRWGVEVRSFCRERGIAYQGFWILTANRELWQNRASMPDFVANVARGAKVSTAVALYTLVMELGVVVLDGTTNMEHMMADLHGLATVAEWRSNDRNNEVTFDKSMADFRRFIADPL